MIEEQYWHWYTYELPNYWFRSWFERLPSTVSVWWFDGLVRLTLED